jgi:hypothetical protein
MTCWDYPAILVLLYLNACKGHLVSGTETVLFFSFLFPPLSLCDDLTASVGRGPHDLVVK